MAHSESPPVYDVAQLFREHASRVERFLLRLGVQPCDVPDATQEVFVVAHRKRHAFEGRASVSTWLYRISVRVACAQRRLARHRRELITDPSTLAADSSQDLAAELEQRARLEHVANALERLSEPQRTVLALHDLDGLRMREVAARLGIPAKTAFSRVYAARRALAHELRRLGYAVPSVLPLWPSGSIVGALAARVRLGKGLFFGASLPMAAGTLGAVLCVALLSPAPHASSPQIARAPVPASIALQPAAAPAALASVPSRSEPPHVKPARPRKSLPIAAGTTPSAAVTAQAEREPEIVITRMGSEELRPAVEHPFARRVQVTPPGLPRMAARLAPIALDPEPPADFD